MKTFALISALAITAIFCFCYSNRGHTLTNTKNTGTKWDDTLFAHLPVNLDTTVTLYDANGIALKFRQYIKPVFNYQAMIFQDKGVWRLYRFTETARDSLKKDDNAVARLDRWWTNAHPDTVSDYKIKLKAVAQTLAQADYVLVYKSRRQMLIKRKGLTMLNLAINLGKQPIGKKEFENDGKTPEGIYHLDLKCVRGDKYYKSVVISYPNTADQLHAKLKGLTPGKGLMVHGTRPDKIKAKDWTAGCIALQNNDMDSLFKYVANGTLIEIRK